MARSRNIKPSIYKNELLGVADPLLTILFTGLWCLADREGRLEDRPLRIKAEIFPYRDLPLFNGYLTELARLGFIHRYEADGMAVIQVVNFSKHQSPHKTEKESELPEIPADSVSCAITVKAPLSNWNVHVKESLIPDSLIPDSRYLKPDLLIPDSLVPAAPVCADTALSTLPAKPVAKKLKPESKGGETWNAYSDAYFARYGIDPVRNAKTLAQVSQLVDRLGSEDAPPVAAFYVHHSNGFYVARMHSVNCLLADAEKLRTEWATGRKVTQTIARQTDRTASNPFAAMLTNQGSVK